MPRLPGAYGVVGGRNGSTTSAATGGRYVGPGSGTARNTAARATARTGGLLGGAAGQGGSAVRRKLQASSRSGSAILDRSWSTALVWIWHTRLSVTPSTSPISARVRPS